MRKPVCFPAANQYIFVQQRAPLIFSISASFFSLSPPRMCTYQILSVWGGGILTASVPRHSCTSTVSSRGVLATSSIFFLMNSVSVAFWKYLDLAILSTNRMILLGRWPPTYLEEQMMRMQEGGSESGSLLIHNSISQVKGSD